MVKKLPMLELAARIEIKSNACRKSSSTTPLADCKEEDHEAP
jgi:hypothetical protein